ncbi:DUF2283 domain-containing protein [Carboxydichorda subterranea]|uniref:DUF2283 domain-containing protein n=1 Tax=Carboxydichorda subterranea TaxID=3109565 RepID=UPI0038579F5B
MGRNGQLTIVLREAPVSESDEDRLGVILDSDARGNLVGLEILDASRRMSEPGSIQSKQRRGSGAAAQRAPGGTGKTLLLRSVRRAWSGAGRSPPECCP